MTMTACLLALLQVIRQMCNQAKTHKSIFNVEIYKLLIPSTVKHLSQKAERLQVVHKSQGIPLLYTLVLTLLMLTHITMLRHA